MLRRITAAYTVNELGNWLGTVALTVAVFDHTKSAIATAGLFVSLRIVPAVVVTPAVARLEQVARRGILTVLYWAQTATTAGLALLVIHPVLAPIFALGAFDGVLALAARALLRAVVSQRSEGQGARRRANGVMNAGLATTATVGPALAGGLTGALGPAPALWLDVASFALAGALVVGVPNPVADGRRSRTAQQLRTAIRHVRANSALAWLLGTEAVALVFFSAVVPVEVVFVKATLHAGDSGYGVLLASWGAGMIVGSAVFARAKKHSLGVLVALGTVAVAVAYLGIAASATLGVACLFSIVGGIGNGMQWVALITSVQDETPTNLQGRLMAVVESMGALFPAIGFALGGAVAALADPRVTFVLAGAVTVLLAFVFALRAARRSRPRGLAATAIGSRPG